MRFTGTERDDAHRIWRAVGPEHERAAADNVWFEERVSADRWNRFELLAPGIESPEALARWQTDYCRTYVHNDDPDTFRAALAPARLTTGLLDTDQRIVRLEKVDSTVLGEAGLSFDELLTAHQRHDTAVQEIFLRRWNDRRDGRPSFGAWKDEMLDELLDPNWADAFRDRLGLAHYNPGPRAPIPVILMEYNVATVLTAAMARAGIVIPTVLDSPPWPWFFPSPNNLDYGRCMDLSEHDQRLRTELLHVPVTYRHDHIARIGTIARPVVMVPLRDRRNRHLATVRTAAGQPEFGEEMA